MKLLVQLQHMILLAKKAHLASLQELIAIRAMRWTLENGVSKYFALFMAQYCAPLRNKGKLQAAGKYAAIVKRLFQRFADEGASEALRSSDFLFCEFIVSYIGRLPCVYLECFSLVILYCDARLATRRNAPASESPVLRKSREVSPNISVAAITRCGRVCL